MTRIKALFFDFDGLIVETEGPVYQSWVELFEAHGCVLPLAEWVTIIGTAGGFSPLEELERQAGKIANLEQVLADRKARELEMVYAQPLLPGVHKYLEDAKQLRLKLAVVSSSSKAWVQGHLERRRLLEYFELLRNKDDVPAAKPDPALYLSALECLELRPNEAIVFEDSPNGIRAAKAAGIFTVAVPNDMTRSLDLSEADLRLESLEEMGVHELLRKV